MTTGCVRYALWTVLVIGALSAPPTSLAEISGSGTPNGECPNEIGDRVWRDLNGNGIQDAGEPGIGGVVVRLERGSWPDIDILTDTTDDEGRYRFYDLCDGSYWLDLDEATLPADVTPTDGDDYADAHGALDNDADDEENRHHIVVSIDDAAAMLTVDFGFREGGCNASIGDRVWQDRDRDGLQDAGEPGIAAVTVDLAGLDGIVLRTDRTDADGRYRFDELCPGEYRVNVAESDGPLAAMLPSPARSGGDMALDSDGPIDAGWVVVDIGDYDRADVDFGYYHPDCLATLGDKVFADDNADGIRQDGERGIAHVTLRLLSAGEVIARTRSDRAGHYRFDGLCAGDYHIDLDESTLPGAYAAAPALAGDDATADSDAPESGGPVAVALSTDDAVDQSIDFGFTPTCSGLLGDRVWVDLNADGSQDTDEPGLGEINILLRDHQGRPLGVATTSDDGRYAFADLCPGEYAIQIDTGSLPRGAAATTTNAANDTVDSDGAAPVWVTLADGAAQDTSIDFGYAFETGCDLALDSSCLVVAHDKSQYSCHKPVDQLTLAWHGSDPVRVVAHRGKDDDPVLADIDPVLPGDQITVSGFAGGPGDVEYHIFATGTDQLLGVSKFNISCSDDQMDGPEHCGTAQGDGKDNKVELINDWRLEGMSDQGGVLDCTPDLAAATDRCEFSQTMASCDSIDGALHVMTMAYTGGGCAASDHAQGDKFKCSGSVDDTAPVMVTLEDGSAFAVEPGQVFALPRDGGDTKLDLGNALGTEHLEIHTSCSRPLLTGDVFGSLTLLAINGTGLGTDVLLVHGIDNIGAVDIAGVSAGTIAGPAIDGGAVATGARLNLLERAYVTMTGTHATMAVARDAGNRTCSATDSVDIDVLPPPPCVVAPDSTMEIHDREIRWRLRNGGVDTVRLDNLSLRWPAENGPLEEIKLGSDKIFDSDRDGRTVLLEPGDWTSDPNKRSIAPGDVKELKIKFKIDAPNPSSGYSVDLTFDRGCNISR